MNEKNEQNFFWIRIFDYSYLRDINSKGILLDEFYEKEKTRDGIKVLISSSDKLFSKSQTYKVIL